jgi:hypothetical protein
MKQIIVMVAMVMLGIIIAGMVSQFGTSAGEMTSAVNSKVGAYTSDVTATPAP